MASSSALLVAAVLAVVVCGAHGIAKVPCGPNITANYVSEWKDAKTTWYGKPTGAGPKDNGGACGYKEVDKAPFFGMTSCGNVPIFKDGRGCGSCFELKCTKPEACSGEPTIVTITDKNEEPIAAYHFDLSGHAFGTMAKKGQEQKLRDAGEVEIKFRRVKCKYPEGTKVNFHVEKGSSPNYLALVIKFLQGDGDVVAVDIKPKGKDKWIELKESWGAVWRIDTPDKLIGPFSVRYTTEGGTKTVAEDVIPEGWKPDTSYETK
ncbi:expansin EXPB4 [Hordeum vulgare]|nr:expansin EXPB4 [Hordeum vulgare]KAI4996657.1 hypothetical protein ZWY2020_051577 [Hordeum vulgare]